MHTVLGNSFKALVFQYMQPWRPFEIVHVGLISAMDQSYYSEMVRVLTWRCVCMDHDINWWLLFFNDRYVVGYIHTCMDRYIDG
jgi:hypothetical protein